MSEAGTEIEDRIVAALRRIVRAIDLQSRRTRDACGLTGPQLVVLRAAAERSGASISELARVVSLSQPTVSGILDRLERHRLVRREPGRPDRRTVCVSITAGGARVLRDAPSLLQDRFRRELTRLEAWERTQMLALLQRLAAMMDAEAIDAAPLLETGALDATGEGGEPCARDAGEGRAPTAAARGRTRRRARGPARPRR